MPGAKTHDTIALVASAVIAPTTYIVLQSLGEPSAQAFQGTLWLTGAHLFGSFWLSPDLDIDGAIDDRWGPFFWVWRPYMWLVPHRHRLLSHSGISGLLRLAYLYGVILLLLLLFEQVAALFGAAPARPPAATFQNWMVDTLIVHEREARLVVLGVILSDLIHTTADHLVTNGKGILRMFGIKIKRSYRDHDRGR